MEAGKREWPWPWTDTRATGPVSDGSSWTVPASLSNPSTYPGELAARQHELGLGQMWLSRLGGRGCCWG